jgi:hypothetical protein
MESPRLNPHMLDEIFKQGEFSTGVIITFQVMAVAGMSPGNPYAICPLSYGRQKELGAHPSGAGNPYHPNIGRVFHSADAGEIRGAVTTPVA